MKTASLDSFQPLAAANRLVFPILFVCSGFLNTRNRSLCLVSSCCGALFGMLNCFYMYHHPGKGMSRETYVDLVADLVLRGVLGGEG